MVNWVAINFILVIFKTASHLTYSPTEDDDKGFRSWFSQILLIKAWLSVKMLFTV